MARKRRADLSAKAKRQILAGTAPDGMTVAGVLDLKGSRAPLRLPTNLDVEVLDLSGVAGPLDLPAGLRAYELNLAQTEIERLPADLRVECRLNLAGCGDLAELPAGLTVGALILRGCTGLVALPEGLDVWTLDLTGCWAFSQWPKRATIRGGRLVLRGCTAVRDLPPYLRRLASADVRDCPNLRSLPPGLEIAGWLDLGHSGLTEEAALPESLDRVSLRWGGIAVDRRIAFRPEELAVAEVLGERNAERRRVLTDRYGYPRLMRDAGAETLDADADPGGPRELLRVVQPGDEDLVALSCRCPSTGRQYIIRVPPATPSCRHAAAWIAGFDDPDEYRPLKET